MPVVEKSNESPACLSPEEKELRLKEYDALSAWNDYECKVNVAIDVLPVSAIGGIAYAVSKMALSPGVTALIMAIPSILIVIIWLALCLKYSERVKKRFELMQQIEREVGFSAHIRMNDFIKNSRLQRSLTHFLSRLIIVLIVGFTLAIAFCMSQKTP